MSWSFSFAEHAAVLSRDDTESVPVTVEVFNGYMGGAVDSAASYSLVDVYPLEAATRGFVVPLKAGEQHYIQITGSDVSGAAYRSHEATTASVAVADVITVSGDPFIQVGIAGIIVCAVLVSLLAAYRIARG